MIGKKMQAKKDAKIYDFTENYKFSIFKNLQDF